MGVASSLGAPGWRDRCSPRSAQEYPIWQRFGRPGPGDFPRRPTHQDLRPAVPPPPRSAPRTRNRAFVHPREVSPFGCLPNSVDIGAKVYRHGWGIPGQSRPMTCHLWSMSATIAPDLALTGPIVKSTDLARRAGSSHARARTGRAGGARASAAGEHMGGARAARAPPAPTSTSRKVGRFGPGLPRIRPNLGILLLMWVRNRLNSGRPLHRRRRMGAHLYDGLDRLRADVDQTMPVLGTPSSVLVMQLNVHTSIGPTSVGIAEI